MDKDFTGDWYGWKVRGRFLVSDDGQKMTQERLRGLLWRDQMELRLAGLTSRKKAEQVRRDRQKVKIVVVSMGDYRLHGVAAG